MRESGHLPAWRGKEKEFRPQAANGLDLINNSVISITYKVGGKCRIYVDGGLISEVNCDATMDADTLFIGHAEAKKQFNTTYRAIRFYNRELTADEVKANAKADGVTVAEGLPTRKYISVAQPQTKIVGDISMIYDVNTNDKLTNLSSLKNKPATAIFTINNNLEVVDSNNTAISTISNIFTLTDFKIVPAFRVSDTAAANALMEYLKKANFYDCIVLSSDPTIIKNFRNSLHQVSGAIDYTNTYKNATALTESQCLDIRKSIKINNASIAILPANICTNNTVQYLYNRQVNVWANLVDNPSETDQYNALLSGAIGVISNATDSLLDIACNKLPENTVTRSTLNIGHRGIPSAAPENTLEGAIYAYEQGANVIEIDIYLSSDGQIVIMHDSTTTRTCNSGVNVESTTLANLKKLYVNKGYENNAKYKSCRIPTLKEFLEYFKGKDCQLFIEIKSSKTAIVPAMKKLIDEYDMYGNCSVITFNESIMSAMRTNYPEMSVGALCSNYMSGSDPESDLRSAMNFIGKYNATLNPSYSGYDAKDIRIALMRGISVYPWTFKGNISVHKNYFLWGYSGLTTNNANEFKLLARNIAPNLSSDKAKVGSTTSLSLNVTSYDHQTQAKDPSSVTILSGSEHVTLSKNKLTFKDAGEVTFILGYNSTISGATYTLYTQPITITSYEEDKATDATDATDAPATEKATDPVIDDTNEFTDDTQIETEEPIKKGCRSVVGGIAVPIIAAIAVGAIIKRKKED